MLPSETVINWLRPLFCAYRWDASKPPTIDNLIMLTFEEVGAAALGLARHLHSLTRHAVRRCGQSSSETTLAPISLVF